jgi:hypothetical protein
LPHFAALAKCAMSRFDRLTVQVASDVRTEIQSAAREGEICAAAIMRQVLRDWADQRRVYRQMQAQHEQ